MTATRPPELPDPRPRPEKDAALVREMFDRVAPRYDLANTVLSLGQDRRWRRAAAHAAGVRPGSLVLDVASGTGMLARDLRAAGAQVMAVDFSWPMLAVGAARSDRQRVLWCNGDGMRLPLRDATFDSVTIAFGLRNLPDTRAGLNELARVTKPGGRLVILEFSSPVWPPFAGLYRRYLRAVVPWMADVVSSSPAAYRYLAESILAWPDQANLARLIASAGWERARWRNLSGGIVAVHQAHRQ
ncbi:MAG TPA: class I SAM-dependent methyltransferase [Egibacteraceae bacterium]|nr:class I SAM-dependent methyltransferase [Egibacteraceae bacterium]